MVGGYVGISFLILRDSFLMLRLGRFRFIWGGEI